MAKTASFMVIVCYIEKKRGFMNCFNLVIVRKDKRLSTILTRATITILGKTRAANQNEVCEVLTPRYQVERFASWICFFDTDDVSGYSGLTRGECTSKVSPQCFPGLAAAETPKKPSFFMRSYVRKRTITRHLRNLMISWVFGGSTRNLFEIFTDCKDSRREFASNRQTCRW